VLQVRCWRLLGDVLFPLKRSELRSRLDYRSSQPELRQRCKQFLHQLSIGGFSKSERCIRRHFDRRYVTPLVAIFDHNSVQFTPCDESLSPFPFAPGIAIDRNRNGTIDDGSELFGSNTVLPGGSLADDGYQASAGLNQNRDGVIDRLDPVMRKMLLWSDGNQNRRSELMNLSH
jgi:hypothetical protein